MIIDRVTGIRNTEANNFFLLAGPCAIEGEEIAMEIARELRFICDKYQIPLIFKGSYRKANRSRLDSFTGIGDAKALKILGKIREETGLPTVTDIHSASEAAMAAPFVDVLQIPAFLSRQTDILVAAAETGRHVNIKKGQFMSPEAMAFAVDKVRETGNPNAFVTDRGTMFGYHDLVVDFRAVPKMQDACMCDVVVDITHSQQKPNQTTGVTGGDPEMIETIAKCAIAAGADGLFLETHPRPSEAKSDGANMLNLDYVEPLMAKLVAIRKATLPI